MNVLITNSQETQAYTILGCVRSEASKVVITTGGDSVYVDNFRGLAFYSRFVDKRYTVPSFSEDWFSGRIRPENTPLEEAYVRRIEQICEDEAIDVVFPSLDPEVYVFSKNKTRLLDQGVQAIVPDYDVLLTPMDKALTIKAAQRVGFPCPKTYFPSNPSEVEEIACRSNPPWIIKPRLTAHGVHVKYADNPAQLEATFAELHRFQAAPIVQEYVQGASRRNFYITVDQESEIISVLSPEVVRTYAGGVRVSSKTVVSSSTGPFIEEIRALVRHLGLSGGFTVQTKVDPNDGLPKLMEINARFGQHLWYRTELGVNEPMICLQLARGETPSGNLEFPDDVMMLDPFHDFFFLYTNAFNAFTRLMRLGSQSADEPGPAHEHQPLMDILRSYRADYFNSRRKIMGPEVRYILNDPYPCLRVFLNKFIPITGGMLRRTLRALRGTLQGWTAVRKNATR
jgi:predicted ATP-grasp superfamily ATP-dependent carboligase